MATLIADTDARIHVQGDAAEDGASTPTAARSSHSTANTTAATTRAAPMARVTLATRLAHLDVSNNPSALPASSEATPAADDIPPSLTAAAPIANEEKVPSGFDMSGNFDSSGSDNDANDGSIYDEVPLHDMEFDAEEGRYTYPCPCGDEFEIYLEDLQDGEDIAYCPSCSLKIRVLRTQNDDKKTPTVTAAAGGASTASK